MYYLNSRYYDPEVCRFINADDISVLDITNIALNGLNLYAYCLNNPVNEVDESGYFLFWLFVTAIVVGAVAGGVSKGVEAYKEGVRGWDLFGSILGGAIMGGAMGAVLTIGGVAGLGALTGASLLGISTGAALSLSLAIGVTAGMASYSVEAAFREDIQWNVKDFFKAGASSMLQGISTFSISYIGGKAGAYDKIVLDQLIKGTDTMSMSVTYSIAKALIGRKYFITPVSESILKNLIIGGMSTIIRNVIDSLVSLM